MAEYDRAVIIGVGLLGGSIGLALRQRQLARTVLGVGRNQPGLERAVRFGAIDAYELDLNSACQGAELVVVCTPVQDVIHIVEHCLPHIASDALVTDVGSTKRRICAGLADVAQQNFCGAHPLAGSEKSGVEHATAKLLERRLTVVTPSAATPPLLVERTERLWQSLGSRTLRMSPDEHDRALAQTSHLPHIVASALAAATPIELLPLAASGWCDTTRVAAGGAELWRQILEENREPVLHALEGFAATLAEWVRALEAGDMGQVEELLLAGKHKRDSVGN